MTTKKNAPEPLDLTLHELCSQIDGHLGRDTGVEAAVLAYRRFSDEAAQLDNKTAYMTALTEGIGKHLDAARTPPMIGRARVERVPARSYTQRRVSSESVKKTDYELWVDSGVTETRLAVKTDLELVTPPSGVRYGSIQAAWRVWEAARDRRRFCEQRRDAARDVLREVFAEAAEIDPETGKPTWGGDALRTSDGWSLGWKASSAFRAARCIEVAAQRGIDLEPMKVTTTIHRSATFRLIEPDEFDEVDEIDGD